MIYTPGNAGLAILQEDLMTRGVMLRRVIAFLLDALLLAAIGSLLWGFCLMFGVITFGLGWHLFGVLPLLPLAYNWLFLCSGFSATPGMAMMGLKVRRNEDLGQPLPLQALAFTILFYVTLALGWIWLCVAVFTVRHRTFHDMLSGLVVVRARALTPAGGFWNMPPGGSAAA